MAGSDYGSQKTHIKEAQSGPAYGNLVASPTRVTYKNNGKNNQWYTRRGGLGGCKKGTYGGSTGKQCDEYPFWATKEGGPKNFPGRVSLKPINELHNRLFGSRIWGAAVQTKGVVSGKTRFMVVPYGAVSFYVVNGKVGGL